MKHHRFSIAINFPFNLDIKVIQVKNEIRQSERNSHTIALPVTFFSLPPHKSKPKLDLSLLRDHKSLRARVNESDAMIVTGRWIDQPQRLVHNHQKAKETLTFIVQWI
jgi:LAS superfamily LD-carboxypeptidase LdcB